MDEFIAYGSSTELPTIHVISDSVGLTAQAVARAAAAQFGVTNPVIEVLPKVRTFEEIKEFIDEHSAVHKRNTGDGRMLVFYTLVDRDLSRQLAEYAGGRDDIVAVDLVTDAIGAIAHMTGKQPSTKPGGLHVADQYYFRRIEAIEFTIAHDDGRNPQELHQADIVLLGVSRSSKTPTSIYLSQQGYKVANIPLDPTTEPPAELEQVDRTRLFGLMTTPEVLIGIRQRRLGARVPSLRAMPIPNTCTGTWRMPARSCANWAVLSSTPKIVPLRKRRRKFCATMSEPILHQLI